MTGASIPAAAQEAPLPGDGSTTVTAIPAWAARQATARPITPPPTTTTSPATWLAMVLAAPPFAGMTRCRFQRSAAR